MSTDTDPSSASAAGEKPFLRWIRNFLKNDGDNTLRETLDGYIREPDDGGGDMSVTDHERILLSNILKLRDTRVINAMIPRADIVAIDVSTTQEELLVLLAEKQYSRIPVYRGTLDDVLGTIHIKDVLGTLAKGAQVVIADLLREIPIVSPAMPILNLLLTMRESRRHMALVVDEFGGIDGLVTVNDVIEMIVGDIEDEHDTAQAPQIVARVDGTFMVDARLDTESFETRFGPLFTEEERQGSDTLAGLIFAMAGRIPARGEILSHSSGAMFEIIDADPRRVHLIKIRALPVSPAAAHATTG